MHGRERFGPPAAVLSGLLLVLIFPLPGLSPLAWGALIPLVIISVDSRPRRAFILGYLAGIVWTAGTLYWTYVYHALALLPIVFILALYTGLFSLSVNIITKKTGREALFFTVPAAWTAIEYLKSLGYLGFPWNSLGYSQYRALPLLQMAEYTGVFGVSFLIASVNGAAAAAFFMRKRPGQAAAVFSLSLALPVFFFFHGRAAMDRYKTPRDEDMFRIAVIQPGIHPEIPWGEYGHVITESIISLNRKAAEEKPFLTVFTETLFSEDLDRAFTEKSWLYGAFCTMTKDSGGYILAGANHLRDGRLYNSAYLVSPECEIERRYDKMKLVPGGEYVPYFRENRIVRNLLGSAGGYSPGHERTVFSAKGRRFAVLICFEGIFGNHARKFVRDGAGFLINITNDAWSRSRASHYQHASMSAVRSIENRVYTVRAGNTGISKVINPAGETEIELDFWTRGYFTRDISAGPAEASFYTRHGDVFSMAVTAVFILLAGFSLRKNPVS